MACDRGHADLNQHPVHDPRVFLGRATLEVVGSVRVTASEDVAQAVPGQAGVLGRRAAVGDEDGVGVAGVGEDVQPVVCGPRANVRRKVEAAVVEERRVTVRP